jgi:CNT family concentrative nucleoside transporter
MERLIGVAGIVVIVAIGLAMSESRRRVPWRLVGAGLLLQLGLALLVLRTPGVVDAVDAISRGAQGVIARSNDGIEFLFGASLSNPAGPMGFIFAVRALPVIIFFASLMAVLYHLGIMQRVVAGLAFMLRRTMGITGTEALATASNVFLGQTEAPLCVQPFLKTMTRAQIAVLMTGGFATISGSVLAAYVGILGGADEEAQAQFLKHLLTASVLSAPAAVVMARIVVPETETPPAENAAAAREAQQSGASNVIDAAVIGATDGLKLALNVAAMLVAFVSLLALLNWPLAELSAWKPVAEWLDARNLAPLSIQGMLGWVFTPLAFLLGVPWSEAGVVGSLMGQKLVLTEFIAYFELGVRMHPAEGAPTITGRSAIIAAYALCGFANFASIGIQIGGIGALAPERRKDLVTLGFRTMFAGALASWMTAAVAGLVVG